MFTVDRQKGATPTPASPSQPSTQTKLKDLFALREEEGESFGIYGLTSLIKSPHPPNRLLPYQPPRSRSQPGARPRWTCTWTNPLSQAPRRLLRWPRPVAAYYEPLYLRHNIRNLTLRSRSSPAERLRAQGQVYANRRRRGDPCSLGGSSWRANAGVEASACQGGNEEPAETCGERVE